MDKIKLVLLLLLASVIYSFAQNAVQVKSADYSDASVDIGHKVDAGPLLERFNREHGIDLQQLAKMPKPLKKANVWGFKVGDSHNWWAADLRTGAPSPGFLSVKSTCQAVGVHCYIFVEDSSWNNGKVNASAVSSIVNAFDNSTPANASKGVYQTDTEVFGNPPDVDNDPRILILILDIKDDYNGTTHQSWTGGFFHPVNEYPGSYSNMAEIYYLDCSPSNLKTESGIASVMQTTAHEFQHMINFNYNGNNPQDTFINESMSLCAEVVNGYPIYKQDMFNGETNHYLLDWRSNSDIVVNDYSRAARYSVYLYDQFSTPVLTNIVQSGKTATEAAVDYALTKVTQTAPNRDFSSALEDWFIANILNDKTINSRWGYTTADVGNAAVREHLSPNVTNYADAVAKYGAQYISYTSGSNLKINFNTQGNSFIKIKAVKYGASSKSIETVTPGVDYAVPDFGTTCSKVTFIVYITDPNAPNPTGNSFAYTSTGTAVTIPADIFYPNLLHSYTFQAPTSGYVAGTNSLKTRGLYQRFDIPGTAPVKEIRYYFANKTITGSADPITFLIMSVLPNGTPGSVLYSTTGTTQQFVLPGSSALPTSITLPQTPAVNVTNNFFVGFEWNSNNDDVFSIYTSGVGDGGGKKRAWWEQSNYALAPISDSFNGGLDIDLAIGVKLNVSTAVEQTMEVIPVSYKLNQNYPNPFNPTTVIGYQVPAISNVSIKVYDMLGREVASLLNEEKTAGSYRVTWNGADNSGNKVTSGIYFYTIRAGGFVETKKMVLMK